MQVRKARKAAQGAQGCARLRKARKLRKVRKQDRSAEFFYIKHSNCFPPLRLVFDRRKATLADLVALQNFTH